jgi:Domain of unknown function (DUF4157)/DNA/RNA non-specific endonuclease
MSLQRDTKPSSAPDSAEPERTGLAPGKHTLVQQIAVPAVQRRAGAQHDDAAVHAAAERGVATPSSPLPHGHRIQQLFGRHDVSSVQAHVGSEAAATAGAMGAQAYATGDHVVLGNVTDLHTAAHEAAHVVQQRGCVQLKGGVGQSGDAYERHADEVASLVVQGQSAEHLLDAHAGGAGRATSARTDAAGAVQRKTTIVDDATDPKNKTAPGTGTGLLKDSKGKVLPKQDAVFGPLLDECATSMEVWFNTNSFDAEGTEPKSGTWPSWWAAAAPKPNNYWVRGHLLNHNLGGPGEQRNLTPITKTANSEHHNNVEKVLKTVSALGGALIGYKVTAKYGGSGPTLSGDANDPDRSVWDKLTLGFDCEYHIIVNENDQRYVHFWVENKR